jgi:hypothetical protein
MLCGLASSDPPVWRFEWDPVGFVLYIGVMEILRHSPCVLPVNVDKKSKVIQ